MRSLLKLEISKPAKDDLEDIAHYTYARHGERQVDVYLQMLFDAMERLTENPGIGHFRSDIPEGYKALNVEGHTLIFTVKEDRVVIIRILHQSRDMRRYLSS